MLSQIQMIRHRIEKGTSAMRGSACKMKKTKHNSTIRLSKSIAQANAQIKNVINKVPVLIVLKDGSRYCGIVRDLQGQELFIQGVKMKKTLPRNSTKTKANI
jgi:hypothetical protein